MAVIGRLLEAQGFRVGIIAQPDWQSAEPFKALGKPNLFFGVTAGNMDSMINRYTADRRIAQRRRLHARRRGRQAARPRGDRLRQRCREAYNGRAHRAGRHRGQPAPHRALRLLVGQGAPLDPGGRQGRHAAVRQCRARRSSRSRIAWRRASRSQQITDVRGTAFMRARRPRAGSRSIRRSVDTPGRVEAHIDPYARSTARRRPSCAKADAAASETRSRAAISRCIRADRAKRKVAAAARPHRHPPAVLRAGQGDPVLYAHAIRVLHLETNPGNARALVQRHGDRDVWLNPPPIPLTTAEMDHVYEPALRARPASRCLRRHAEDPGLGDDPLLGEHHARLLRRLHLLLDHRARGPHHPEPLRGLGHARDRGDPRQGRRASPASSPTWAARPPTCTAWPARSPRSRRPAASPVCVYPGICPNLNTDHDAADQAVPQGARAAGHQEDPDRLGPALRPGGAVARVREGAGARTTWAAT